MTHPQGYFRHTQHCICCDQTNMSPRIHHSHIFNSFFPSRLLYLSSIYEFTKTNHMQIFLLFLYLYGNSD
jgi:hypothetical protein